MKTEDINSLLTKFYEGETSPEEETRLFDFFRQENLPAEWEKDRELFISLSAFEPEIPNELEDRMSEFIDSLEKSENQAKKVGRKIEMRRYVVGIAASVLLIIGVGLWNQSRKSSDENFLADTYETPEQAQEATMEALQLFSQHFSKGVEPLKKADEKLESAQKIINNAIKK